MKALIAAIALSAFASHASANAIQDALKKVGPAYMCGPHHEYLDALSALRFELVKAGLTERLADYTIEGVRKAAEANADVREQLTAAECATKYGRT
jgi:hypothetical protein